MTRDAGFIRSAAERLAAVAAVQDPSLLMRLRATPAPPARRPGAGALRRAFAGETGAATALLTAVALALVWANGPWAASYDGFWHARIALTVGPWTLAPTCARGSTRA